MGEPVVGRSLGEAVGNRVGRGVTGASVGIALIEGAADLVGVVVGLGLRYVKVYGCVAEDERGS